MMTYTEAFKKIAENNIQKVIVADITSSLDPLDSHNYVCQIEPSSVGGEKIARMLKHLMTHPEIRQGNCYRFQPAFFDSTQSTNSNSLPVIVTLMKDWTPMHPNTFKKGYSALSVITQNDLLLLHHLAYCNTNDSKKISTSIFKIFNSKDRFQLLLDKIRDVVETYAENKPNKLKREAITACVEHLNNKGFLQIYTMNTPGYQTPFQTCLDRLQNLLSVRNEDEQATLLIQIYNRYTALGALAEKPELLPPL